MNIQPDFIVLDIELVPAPSPQQREQGPRTGASARATGSDMGTLRDQTAVNIRAVLSSQEPPLEVLLQRTSMIGRAKQCWIAGRGWVPRSDFGTWVGCVESGF